MIVPLGIIMTATEAGMLMCVVDRSQSGIDTTTVAILLQTIVGDAVTLRGRKAEDITIKEEDMDVAMIIMEDIGISS
ncbi:Uncharacterised protein [Sphingobacterium thalpophilum]|uniref:Uncharacterized protein n=1 Tax=Sphingobacterium thalpophilum TaxID=259 RepID=A0A4U9VLB6_9SPHI|nr:Uncharacterised protein [Sphingobacterium thalpophilum]